MISKRLDKSLSTLIKDCDAVFSEYIRRKASDGSGFIKCFICGNKIPWRQSQAMHFIDRDQMPVRYDEMNVRTGCVECNCMDPDHKERFRKKLMEIMTPEGMEHLYTKSRGLQKFMRHELLEIIDTYKAKLKELR